MGKLRHKEAKQLACISQLTSSPPSWDSQSGRQSQRLGTRTWALTEAGTKATMAQQNQGGIAGGGEDRAGL